MRVTHVAAGGAFEPPILFPWPVGQNPHRSCITARTRTGPEGVSPSRRVRQLRIVPGFFNHANSVLRTASKSVVLSRTMVLVTEFWYLLGL